MLYVFKMLMTRPYGLQPLSSPSAIPRTIKGQAVPGYHENRFGLVLGLDPIYWNRFFFNLLQRCWVRFLRFLFYWKNALLTLAVFHVLYVTVLEEKKALFCNRVYVFYIDYIYEVYIFCIHMNIVFVNHIL